ncbi:hypothetical protein B4U80_11957 [Leptotrombidium deliense]|uniref:Uncharacterized protein n=1 Tax=Leptotrombidium deliense TaxID=299467 RepID=A0A443S0F8_9ACAR|nr:hypothetical protein B4U80_11957 [Leptotrombidium deliense]
MDELQTLQLELSFVNARASGACTRLKRKVERRCQSHLDRRRAIIERIPGFWAKVVSLAVCPRAERHPTCWAGFRRPLGAGLGPAGGRRGSRRDPGTLGARQVLTSAPESYEQTLCKAKEPWQRGLDCGAGRGGGVDPQWRGEHSGRAPVPLLGPGPRALCTAWPTCDSQHVHAPTQAQPGRLDLILTEGAQSTKLTHAHTHSRGDMTLHSRSSRVWPPGEWMTQLHASNLPLSQGRQSEDGMCLGHTARAVWILHTR